MPTRTQQIFYSICASCFSFWFTVRVLEPLWPKAEARPLILPTLWLLLSAFALCFSFPFLASSMKNRRWIIVALLLLMAIGPILAGYIALLLQMSSIGFVLSE